MSGKTFDVIVVESGEFELSDIAKDYLESLCSEELKFEITLYLKRGYYRDHPLLFKTIEYCKENGYQLTTNQYTIRSVPIEYKGYYHIKQKKNGREKLKYKPSYIIMDRLKDIEDLSDLVTRERADAFKEIWELSRLEISHR